MNEWFKIIVYILERMLHKDKPLFDRLKKVDVFISDGIRHTEINWSVKDGANYHE